jgi:hypothetical protein
MSKSKFTLPRRTVLRGAAAGASATVALPLLEAMVDANGEALADGAPLPVRFVSWFFGNGVRLDRFTPAQAYPNPWTLSEELEPLAEVKDYVSVLTGFNNRSAHFITHHEGNTIFSGYDIIDVGPGFHSNAGGPTIDQVIADIISEGTPIRSVQIGISKRPSDVDFGTTTHNLSHAGIGNPLTPEVRPRKVWENLFDSFVPPDDPKKGLRTRVVDLVREHATDLKKRLGQKDSQRLDAHLDGINELQKKIEAIPPVCENPDEPIQNNDDINGVEQLTDVTSVMHDLLITAFKCDITRVASVLFAEPAALTVYNEVGHTDNFHSLTHSPSSSVQNGEVHEGVIYSMERFADLLVKLKNTEDGVNGGNMLDSSALFCSTDCAEGESHSIDGQPMIIAGTANGKLTHPGVHYASQTGDNPSDALLALLQCFDDTQTSVGDAQCGSNSPLDVLKS